MDTTNATTQLYAKHFIPLESDPPVLNDLMYGLGVSDCLALADVWSLDDPVQLSSVSRPVYALILILPTCEEYERHRQSSKRLSKITEDPKGGGVIWIRQTIDNACGLYAILHATCNLKTREFIGTASIAYQGAFTLTTRGRLVPDSLLSKIAASSSSEREAILESSTDLEIIYRKAALRGNTAPPPAEEEVDLHYICFVKSLNGSVYEMDGDANGPVQTDLVLGEDQDLLESSALECVRRCIARSEGNVNFGLLALVHNTSNSHQTH